MRYRNPVFDRRKNGSQELATLACCSGCLGWRGVGAAAALPTGVAGSRCVSRTTEPEAGFSVSAVGVPVRTTLGVPDTAAVGVPVTRVSDPGIHLIRIRIQHFRLNTYPDPGCW
jgi:hypothetical protein